MFNAYFLLFLSIQMVQVVAISSYGGRAAIGKIEHHDC